MKSLGAQASLPAYLRYSAVWQARMRGAPRRGVFQTVGDDAREIMKSLGAQASLPAYLRYSAVWQARMRGAPRRGVIHVVSADAREIMRTAQLGGGLPVYCLLPTAFCSLRSLSDGSCDVREMMKSLGAVVSLPAYLLGSATQAGKETSAPGGVIHVVFDDVREIMRTAQLEEGAPAYCLLFSEEINNVSPKINRSNNPPIGLGSIIQPGRRIL